MEGLGWVSSIFRPCQLFYGSVPRNQVGECLYLQIPVSVNQLPHPFLRTHPCSSEFTVKRIVWMLCHFENNSAKMSQCTKHFKRSCWLGTYQYFSMKYFPEFVFVRKISPKYSGCFLLFFIAFLKVEWVYGCDQDLICPAMEKTVNNPNKQKLLNKSDNFKVFFTMSKIVD